MVSLGEYILLWACETPCELEEAFRVGDGAGAAASAVTICGESEPPSSPKACRRGCGTVTPALPSAPRRRQYVFCDRGASEEEPLTTTLRRVKTLPDLLNALAGSPSKGSPEYATLATVALLAFLGGNLIAAGRWLTLLGFGAVGAGLALLELSSSFVPIVAVLVWFLYLNAGDMNLEWVATEMLVVVGVIGGFIVIAQCIREDPRSYVLLLESHGGGDGATVIRNACCMDIKLLIFDSSDQVRLVPHGGLLGGVLVPRGESFQLGCRPPYLVKAYAPFERELGFYEVPSGVFSFQATVPPLVLCPADRPRFANNSEEAVTLCICDPQCWTSSLWLPFAPLIARLRWPALQVHSRESVDLPGACVLRVYGRNLGLSQLACARLREGERADFSGCLHWTGARSTFHRSCSSLLHVVR